MNTYLILNGVVHCVAHYGHYKTCLTALTGSCYAS